jgi:DnaJ-class molecular chaperone
MDDPYKILGVAKDASKDEIRQAYRALAKKLHPDLNPGDKEAEARFKQVSAAYGLLSDEEKRRQFDAGEIDADGHERPERQYYRAYGDGAEGAKYAHFGEDVDLDDLFSNIFNRGGGMGGGPRAGRGGMRMRGADTSYTMRVSFLEAANGAKKRITMPDGQTLDITIPEGCRDLQTLRLKGKGMPGHGEGAPSGDAYVQIVVEPHPTLRRDGDDIHLDLPVALDEAVLGASVTVPTLSGNVSLKIPEGSNTGRTLRLKGKGVKSKGKHGDLLVHLVVTLPEKPDDKLKDFLKEWAEDNGYDPRKNLKGAA